jgi:peptidyl-prolyl cis-trans isomerase SurA
MKFSAPVLCLFALLSTQVAAQDQRIIATVNDRPVTTLDIDQQMRLETLLGTRSDGQRKKALNAVINEIVKIEEAKRYKMQPSDRDIEVRLGEIAKGLKTDATGLEGKLRAQGIGMRAMRQYVGAQIAFARLLRFKYKDEVKVDQSEIDRKFASIKADIDSRVRKAEGDPRRRPVTVYKIMEISFPVQSRAAEANQFISRFKGCGSAKAAASGIFNVKVGKQVEADAARLPAPLRKLLQSKGPGQAHGPMRAQSGIQVVAFCGSRTLTPPPIDVKYPTRDQIANAAMNDKFETVEAKYLAQMRKNAIIEFKDQAYAQ